MRTRRVEIVGRGDDDNRYAPAARFQRHDVEPLMERAGADGADVAEAEHVAQKRLDEALRCRRGGRRAGSEAGKQRLADAEIARDLVAQGEALRNVVVAVSLLA